jgi:predicted acylesterase/phospholipase RssA
MSAVSGDRDVAVVLSGGGMNGVLMELGFLQRVRESEYWPRIGWIYGTSSGALAGTMAALDRLDALEEFLLSLQPDETFRPHRLWQLPLLGLHDYTLPHTIEERIGDPVELARALARAEVEVTVLVADVTGDEDPAGVESLELAYSSKRTPPAEFAQAVLASAAISALVLPLPVGDRIATDGGWVRNFPLGYAYDQPGVETILAFRYVPRYPRMGTAPLAHLRHRLERFGRVPPIRAFISELREAEARAERNEPAHLVDMIARLMRVTFMRNSVLEERVAEEKDASIRELEALRRDVCDLARKHVRAAGRRARLLEAIDGRFAAARFPFRHDRAIPRITVRAFVEDVRLDPGFRTSRPWTEEAKRILIRRGYDLADAELGSHEQDEPAAAANR